MGFPAGFEFLVVAVSFAVSVGDLGQGGGVDGMVEFAVPAAVEPVAHCPSAAGFDGCGAVGHGELVLGRIVAGVAHLRDDGGSDQHTDAVNV